MEVERASALSRVYSLPLVNSAMNVVWDKYEFVKNSNGMVTATLSFAENSAKYASNYAQPLYTKLEKHASLIDSVCSTGLDKIEEKFPLILLPPEEVSKILKIELVLTVFPF